MEEKPWSLYYLNFFITGTFEQNIAVDCPAELFTEQRLAQYFKTMAMRKQTSIVVFYPVNPLLVFLQQPEFPSIYGAMALPLILLILFLNQKVAHYGIRIFTNFYLIMQAIHCFLLISETIYKYIWALIFTKNIICGLDGASSYILFPMSQEWGEFRMYYYPLAYTYLMHSCLLFNEWSRHILTWPLILHRISTYCACAYPFLFQKWFTEKKLRWIYFIAVIQTFIFVYCKRQFYGYYASEHSTIQAENSYIAYFKLKMIFELSIFGTELLLHLIITILSIKGVFTFRNKTSSAKHELKYFLYFSIFPMLSSAVSLLFNILSSVWDKQGLISDSRTQISYSLDGYSQIAQSIALFLDDSRPLQDGLLLFICVPIFRKTFVKVFFQRTNITTSSVTVLNQKLEERRENAIVNT